MNKWTTILSCVLTGVVYVTNSILLPDWRHVWVGVLSGVVMLVAYYATPPKLKEWSRELIAAAVSILVAALIRIFS